MLCYTSSWPGDCLRILLLEYGLLCGLHCLGGQGQAGPQLLVKGVRVWKYEVEIDQGEYKHLLGMAWMICATVGQMGEKQIEKVKQMVINVMMKGMVYWLNLA